MKRILLVLTVAFIMVAIVLASAPASFAKQPPGQTGNNNNNNGQIGSGGGGGNQFTGNHPAVRAGGQSPGNSG